MYGENPVNGVAEWYAGRSIFVTGATGFMGKVLVEKLLRSCPDIKHIYVLVRPKKGLLPEQRLKKNILNAELFDILRSTQPEALEKVIPIKGDIISPDLGLSQEDRDLLIENVTVVFHSAATVKFDEALKLSVSMNIVGTGVLLKLCEKMKQLDAFVHVSTAYCNCHLQMVEEKIYPGPTDVEKLLKYMDTADDNVINAMTSKIITNRPNTYTFTKALGEQLLLNHSPSLPIVVVRPSIVTASWREPVPGWVDNLNGPTGLILGAGKGVVRSSLCHKDKFTDFMPVDVAISLMICVAWYTGVKRPKNIEVYNCTSGSKNPFTWGDMENYGIVALYKNPFSNVWWYPGGSFKSSRLHNFLCCFCFHVIPAYVLDFVAFLMGKKRIMVRTQKRVSKACQTLEYFTTRQWTFVSENMNKIWEQLSEHDKKTFKFDIKDLDWKEYIINYHLGVRRYILQDKDDTLESAKVHLKRMKVLHHFVQFLFICLIYWITIRNTWLDNSIFQYFYSIISCVWIFFSELLT